MSIGPVIHLAGGYIQSLFASAVSGSSSGNTASSTPVAAGNNQDTNQLSPFAQVLSSLQQLEQSNLPQYQQVTQQIASHLQTASQSATAAGSTSLASQLTQLSSDFNNASTSGQLPDIQDLAQALGGGGRLHHHHPGGPANASSPSGSGSSPDTSLNAQSIIDNTLSSAGIQIG